MGGGDSNYKEKCDECGKLRGTAVLTLPTPQPLKLECRFLSLLVRGLCAK